jgi:hypothetical protein
VLQVKFPVKNSLKDTSQRLPLAYSHAGRTDCDLYFAGNAVLAQLTENVKLESKDWNLYREKGIQSLNEIGSCAN